MTAEVRGRGRKWKVLYEDEAGLGTPLPVFDREGNYKETVYAGAPTGKMVESYGGPFKSQAEAEEYARWLGASEVRVVRTQTRSQSLAKARTAARRKERVTA